MNHVGIVALILALAACSSPVTGIPDAGMDAATSAPDSGEPPIDTGGPSPDAFAVDAPIVCSGPGDCPAAANATARCESNTCLYDCAAGFGNCDAVVGCEQPLDVAAHCGSCTTDCGDTYCERGSCGTGVTREWLTRIRGAGPDTRPRGPVIVDTEGGRNRILVFGYVDSGAAVTAGAITTTGGGGTYDGYLASLTPGGTVSMARNIGGAGEDFVNDIAVTSTGQIVVVGTYTVAFDGLPAARGGTDGFVMLLSEDGVTRLAVNTWRGTGDDAPTSVEIESDGSILVFGQFSADTELAGSSRSPGTGTTDLAVVRYSPTLVATDFTYFGASGMESHGTASLRLQGTRIRSLFGFTGSVNLGALGRFDSPPSGYDILLLELAPADLHVTSARQYGGPGEEYAVMTPTSDGRLVIVFESYGALDLGGAPIPAPTSSQVVALGLDAADAFDWQFVMGGTAANETYGLSSVGPNTYVSLRFTSPMLDVGGSASLTRRGLRDGAIVSLDRDGLLRWTEHFFGSSDCYINPAGVGGTTGRLFVTGTALGTCTVIAGGDVSSPAVDTWVHAMDP